MIPETWVIQPNRLKKTSEQWVGRGGFGAVWRAVYYEDPRSAPVHVALKELPASATNAGVVHPDICQEIIMWRRLQHPNIVPMLGIDRHIFPLSIASAWMDNGTITQFLENYPNEDRLRLLREVCEGLRFLHMETFAHGDLKSPNILVDSMRHARLCDFGMTTVIHSLNSANASTESHGEKGTTRYLAPELLDPEQYGLQHAHVSLPADIYALGIVIWEVFAGRVPYGRWRGPQVIQQVLAGYRLTRPERARALGLSDDLWGVVVACWHPNWDMRPTAVQVLGAITEEAASTLVSPNLDPRILVSMAEIFRDS
ncbi:kinase-like domain-containing protein [Rhodofomes roseus]|uniref:Kinase-like domain-containing protein n=1 Tax=Rhodofomes roseus TaxID=34475 RepID=A0ABQ8KQA8_9APHY|nr:kinase-like domain-containing protein [Rhodofomes roseus]KAH9840783.1 kinase-like domain-containing protein [Rhodofomes roseus]